MRSGQAKPGFGFSLQASFKNSNASLPFFTAFISFATFMLVSRREFTRLVTSSSSTSNIKLSGLVDSPIIIPSQKPVSIKKRNLLQSFILPYSGKYKNRNCPFSGNKCRGYPPVYQTKLLLFIGIIHYTTHQTIKELNPLVIHYLKQLLTGRNLKHGAYYIFLSLKAVLGFKPKTVAFSGQNLKANRPWTRIT